MQQRSFPPTRKSISQTGQVKPFGPHHCMMYFGSVHAFQTSSRGASKTRVTTIRSTSLPLFSVISDLLFLHLPFFISPFFISLITTSSLSKLSSQKRR